MTQDWDMKTNKVNGADIEKLSRLVSSDIGGASLLERIADIGQMSAVAIALSIAAIIMSVVAVVLK